MILPIDISIVIVNYNVRDFLFRCIESIYANSGQRHIEIIVVDNHSVDGSVGALRQNFPEVLVIANEQNMGFGSANNQGISIARGKYTLILNPDTLLSENTLEVCFQYLEQHPQTGAIGAQMVDGAGKYLPESKRGLPTLWSSFCKMTGLYRLFPTSKSFNNYYLGHIRQDESADIEVLTGAFMFTQTTLLQQLGGFDDHFFMYGEDIDLSKRILDSGYKIHYLPAAKIVHFKGESTKKTSIKYHKSFYQAMSIYAEKHFQSKSTLFVPFLKVAIAIIGSIHYLKNLFLSLWKPLLGLIFGIFSYVGVQLLWGMIYFHDIGYYEPKNIVITSVLASLTIVTSVWFFGWYDQYAKRKYLNAGILVAAVIILMIYALLPTEFRNSRVVLFLGLVFTYFIFLGLRMMGQKWRNSTSESKKILFIANESRSRELFQIMSLDKHNEIIGTVSPDEKDLSSAYINHVGKLTEVIKTLKPNEVVFDAASMKMSKILELMSFPMTDIHYKIAGHRSQAIVGSKSSKNRGEIYSVESTYNLAKPLYLRLKRLVDIVFSLLLLPISIFVNKVSVKKLCQTIIGKTTLVAYHNLQAAHNLPALAPGIFTTQNIIGELIQGNFVDTDEKADICYAKYYHPVQDIKIVLSNLKKQ
ncbi:MAG TPA: glycosyltransferase [Saprospiraceae bacterium]|nr:glycosyltransferase [Saprospiraceae bacterium]